MIPEHNELSKKKKKFALAGNRTQNLLPEKGFSKLISTRFSMVAEPHEFARVPVNALEPVKSPIKA